MLAKTGRSQHHDACWREGASEHLLLQAVGFLVALLKLGLAVHLLGEYRHLVVVHGQSVTIIQGGKERSTSAEASARGS